MENIVKVLKETKGVSDYRIVETKTESCELFYVLDKLETNRATNIEETVVTIYVKKGKMKGSADITIYKYMSIEDIKKKVEEAVYAAKLALNPTFKLPKPSKKEVVSPKSNLSDRPFTDVIGDVVNAVYKANKYKHGWLNSVEFFLKKKMYRLVNSNGIDESYTAFSGEIEVIPTWKKGKEEFELYEMIKFSNLDLNDITRQVENVLLQAKARAEAKVPNIKEGTKIIISGDSNIPQIIDYFVDDLSYSALYNKVNRCKVGDSVQGEVVTGDKLNIDLVPIVHNSPSSRPFDMDGVVLSKISIIKDGIAKANYGSNQMASYLGIKKPTGMIPNVVVKHGSKSIKEMKKEPYLECIKFSAFQTDPYSGFFGGEVRLGYYFDGEKSYPVTGFAISGNLHELKGTLVFSKEIETLPGYKVPKAVEIKGMKIA